MRDDLDLTLDLEARVAQLERERALRPGPLTWTAPTLINSWVNSGGGFTTAGYLIDNAGFVHLRGTISGGASAAVVFVLPPAFRPPLTVNAACTISTATLNTAGIIRADANGNVIIYYSGTLVFAGIDGVTYDLRA